MGKNSENSQFSKDSSPIKDKNIANLLKVEAKNKPKSNFHGKNELQNYPESLQNIRSNRAVKIQDESDQEFKISQEFSPDKNEFKITINKVKDPQNPPSLEKDVFQFPPNIVNQHDSKSNSKSNAKSSSKNQKDNTVLNSSDEDMELPAYSNIPAFKLNFIGSSDSILDIEDASRMIKDIEEGVYLSKRDKNFNKRFELGDFSSLSRHTMKPMERGLKKNELENKDLPKYKKVERVPKPDDSIFEKFESYLEVQAKDYAKKNEVDKE